MAGFEKQTRGFMHTLEQVYPIQWLRGASKQFVRVPMALIEVIVLSRDILT